MARARQAAQPEYVADLASRLQPFLEKPDRESAGRPEVDGYAANGSAETPWLEELVERALRFLTVIPSRPRRGTLEELVCPGDRERGRAVIDALVARGLAQEDERGYLHRVRATPRA